MMARVASARILTLAASARIGATRAKALELEAE